MIYSNYNQIRERLHHREPFQGNCAWATIDADGNYAVYSYGTEMLRETKEGEVHFNSRNYSVTTSRLQNMLRAEFDTENAKLLIPRR